MSTQTKKREHTHPVFLNVDELAEMMRVKPRTIYHWVQNGLVPHRKPSGHRGRVLFLLDEILDWMKVEK
jgi:excisionase family DNA binding protein